MSSNLKEALALRKAGKFEEALKILLDLHSQSCEDANVNYQIASTYDNMGKESDALAYYEKAISGGLLKDRQGAMLGLGSTYRCLGQYQKSLEIFNQAIAEFPEDRSYKVFRALTLHNLGLSAEALGDLLTQLLDTTSDTSIKSYERALRFYSDKLDETWK